MEMTDQEKIRRAVEEETFVGNVAPILAKEIRRLQAENEQFCSLLVEFRNDIRQALAKVEKLP